LEHYEHSRATGQLAGKNMFLQASGEKTENFTEMSAYWRY
jgi:hypothetical protein